MDIFHFAWMNIETIMDKMGKSPTLIKPCKTIVSCEHILFYFQTVALIATVSCILLEFVFIFGNTL